MFVRKGALRGFLLKVPMMSQEGARGNRPTGVVKPVHHLHLGKEARLRNSIKGTQAPAQLSVPLEASAAILTVSQVSVSWQNQGWDQGSPTGQNMAGGGQPGGCRYHLCAGFNRTTVLLGGLRSLC